MKLNYQTITKSSLNVNKVKDLFESAFPEEERPSFNIFINFKRQTIRGIYKDDEFIGFYSYVKNNDLFYLFFFALLPEYRNNGLGSIVLHDIQNEFIDYRIFLLAEEIDPKYEDNDMRIRRINFYKRNNFILSNTKILEYEVMYHLLYVNKEVSKQEFLDTMLYLIGEEMFRKYYC